MYLQTAKDVLLPLQETKLKKTTWFFLCRAFMKSWGVCKEAKQFSDYWHLIKIARIATCVGYTVFCSHVLYVEMCRWRQEWMTERGPLFTQFKYTLCSFLDRYRCTFFNLHTYDDALGFARYIWSKQMHIWTVLVWCWWETINVNIAFVCLQEKSTVHVYGSAYFM